MIGKVTLNRQIKMQKSIIVHSAYLSYHPVEQPGDVTSAIVQCNPAVKQSLHREYSLYEDT